MKKTLLVAALSLGVLLAGGVALAAAIAPVPSPTSGAMMQSWPTGGQQMQSSGAMMRTGMPCVMMNQADGSSNMMYRTSPCGGMMAPNMMAYYGRGMAGWLGLMFVLTVLLVWIVLLLLIAVLWHMLKKHRKS